MDPLDAFYQMVHDYPGGAESLAPRMGYTPAVLRNKADPKKDSNKPLLADVDMAVGLTGDNRVIKALAHKHGYLLIKAPDGNRGECDMSVLEQLVGLAVVNGEYMRTIHAALSDGRVDAGEVAMIREAGRALQTATAETTCRIEGMAE